MKKQSTLARIIRPQTAHSRPRRRLCCSDAAETARDEARALVLEDLVEGFPYLSVRHGTTSHKERARDLWRILELSKRYVHFVPRALYVLNLL